MALTNKIAKLNKLLEKNNTAQLSMKDLMIAESRKQMNHLRPNPIKQRPEYQHPADTHKIPGLTHHLHNRHIFQSIPPIAMPATTAEGFLDVKDPKIYLHALLSNMKFFAKKRRPQTPKIIILGNAIKEDLAVYNTPNNTACKTNLVKQENAETDAAKYSFSVKYKDVQHAEILHLTTADTHVNLSLNALKELHALIEMQKNAKKENKFHPTIIYSHKSLEQSSALILGIELSRRSDIFNFPLKKAAKKIAETYQILCESNTENTLRDPNLYSASINVALALKSFDLAELAIKDFIKYKTKNSAKAPLLIKCQDELQKAETDEKRLKIVNSALNDVIFKAHNKAAFIKTGEFWRPAPLSIQKLEAVRDALMVRQKMIVELNAPIKPTSSLSKSR